MSDNQAELLRDIIARVMDTLNTRRKNMFEFFDDFDEEFMHDGFDDGMEDSLDPDQSDELSQEDEQSDELSWDEAYWIGTGIGWVYEEGRWKRRKRKDAGPYEPSDINRQNNNLSIFEFHIHILKLQNGLVTTSTDKLLPSSLRVST